jgi:hypothetical protein
MKSACAWMVGSRSLRRALVAALALGAFATAAPATGLLVSASQSDARMAAGKGPVFGPEALRSRIVHIDRDELARHVAPIGIDTVSDRVARAGKLDGVVSIELFPDVTATFRRKDVDTIGDSGYAWVGEVAGQQFSFASLIVGDSQITGHIQLFHSLFRIDPLGNGIHRVTEIDQGKFPVERYIEVPGKSGSLRAPEPRVKTQIRILVAYTKAANTESGGNVVNEIKQAVSLANAAYANTKIPIKLVLAKSISAGSYNESTGGDEFSINLDDVTGNNGNILKNVRDARESYDADLVSLFRKNGVYCGIGWLPDHPGASTSNLAYHVMNRGCVTNYSMHHEAGHNMGLHHDRYVDAPASNAEYHFGFVNTSCQIRTVMAYNNKCSDSGFNCTRINFFSTPNFVTNQGSCQIGVKKGAAGAADNTKRLRETRAAVAAYR